MNRDEGRWDDVKERFSIPDPQQIMAEVDRIVEEKLGDPPCG